MTALFSKLVRCAVLAFCAPLALSQSVLVVDSSGAGDFLDIQPAVLAAADGDHLLVRAGNYGPVLIAGKGLSILADRGATVTVNGGVQVVSTLE